MAAVRQRRSLIHVHSSSGEHLAAAIAAGVGRWWFLLIQGVLVLIWWVRNIVGRFALRWDPYPFILLNLLFPTQAAYAAPIIMMSQNRQATKDHKRDDLEAEEVEELFKINHVQLS